MRLSKSILSDQFAALREAGLTTSTVFFEETPEFIAWLKTEAGTGVVLEIGCGTGKTLHAMAKAEIACVGVDPLYPEESRFKYADHFVNVIRESADETIEKLVPGFVAAGRPVIIMTCRPCHNGFVEDALDASRGTGARFLYVSKPSNIWVDLDKTRHYVEQAFPEIVGDCGEYAYWVTYI